jgi:hypothetical protein
MYEKRRNHVTDVTADIIRGNDMSAFENLALWEQWNEEWMPKTRREDDKLAFLAEHQTYEQERNRRRELFMVHYGLKRSRGEPMLSKVVGRRLHKPSTGLRLYDEKQEYREALGWFDHSELFYRTKDEYVLTTQPYDVTATKVEALRRLCAQWELTVEVLPSSGWHYPGRCPLIVVRKAVTR